MNERGRLPASWMLADEQATEALGGALAQCCRDGGLVFLRGSLGAGKTTTARGLLRGLGYTGKAKSPTYTLVEPYEFLQPAVYHFDLYRLGDPEELEFMGFRDFLQRQALCLIEWPERGGDWLGRPDLELALEAVDEQRLVHCRSHTDRGHHMAASLSQLVTNIAGISDSPVATDESPITTGTNIDV